MNQRQLGSLTVSALGLGCMGMSDFYGQRDDATSLRTLDKALDLGVTFWDTSDIYGPLKNELLLGQVFLSKAKRDQVVLATKFGILRDPETGAPRGLNSRPEYIRSACEASLRRLNTNHIDLYYQHRVDPEVPIDEVVGALAELVQEGKVRYIGLSEAGPATIRRAHREHPITALQTEYSLWSRDPESDILPLVQELEIGFVAYSPLGRGFLTGKIKTLQDLEEGDWRRDNPRFTQENLEANLRLVGFVEELAQDKGCTAAQLALAWVLHQGDFIVPIPGTRSETRLAENAAAATLTLSVAELEAIAERIPVGAAQGTRYPEAMMGLLSR